jgi:four helix bundle protein
LTTKNSTSINALSNLLPLQPIFSIKFQKGLAVHDQLDRASTAIPLNIAEGSGKWTAPDRCRFYDIARGSALECAAALDVAVAKKILRRDEITDAKQILIGVVSMLVKLIKSVAPGRTYRKSEGENRTKVMS